VRDVVEYDATSGETVVAASADYGAFGEVFSAAPPFDPSGGGGSGGGSGGSGSGTAPSRASVNRAIGPNPEPPAPNPNNRGLTPDG